MYNLPSFPDKLVVCMKVRRLFITYGQACTRYQQYTNPTHMLPKPVCVNNNIETVTKSSNKPAGHNFAETKSTMDYNY